MSDFPPGSIWPAHDAESAQTREVYARYGLAMYMAQVLEHGMVNALITMRILPTMRCHADATDWHKTFDVAYETGLSHTYGNMLRELEKFPEFPTDIFERIKMAKEDRDILAHRFFRHNDLAFMNLDGRTHMIAWCEQRIDLFKSLSDEIDEFIAPIQAKYGITEDWVECVYQKSLEEARNWTSDAEPRP